jgi:8-oxo-dGTP pyrophosphatase MutT (NUDIX family)
VALRADDCVTTRGVPISPYYVLEYPDFVHALAIDEAGCVILVRQYRHGLREMSLELPGGVMDAGDADPCAAAARELREETGYAGRAYRHIAALSSDPAKMSNRLHLVLAEGVTRVDEPKPDAAEEIGIERVTSAEAVRLATSGAMVHAGHVALLLIGLRAAGRIIL